MLDKCPSCFSCQAIWASVKLCLVKLRVHSLCMAQFDYSSPHYTTILLHFQFRGRSACQAGVGPLAWLAHCLRHLHPSHASAHSVEHKNKLGINFKTRPFTSTKLLLPWQRREMREHWMKMTPSLSRLAIARWPVIPAESRYW